MHHQKTYAFVWGESDSLLTLEAAISVHTRARQVFATEPRDMIITCQQRMARAYYLARDLKRARNVGKQLLRPEVMRQYVRGCQEVEAKVLHFKNEMTATQWRKLTDRQLLNTLKTYHHLLILVLAYYQASTVPEYLEPVEVKLRSLLRRPSDLTILIQPPLLTEVEEERLALLKLAGQRRITSRDIMQHINTFPHLAYNTYDVGRVVQFMRRRLRADRALPARKRLVQGEEILQRKRWVAQQQRRMYRRYASPPLERLAGLIQTMGYWRFRLKSYWAGAEFWFSPMFQEIADRLNVDIDTLMWVYSTRDIARALPGRHPLPRQLVRTRKASYTYALRDGKVSLLTGRREKKFLAAHLKVAAERTAELRGTIAQSGRATGPVKIIHVHDLQRYEREAKTFRTGDILVTTMTQVHAIPLMQRSAAVLTEQGGITSHAAIIARELNKPCLVGVQHATTVLNNGDVINVDAERGTVTIVERAAVRA